MKLLARNLAFAALLGIASAANAQITYSLDDGTGESSVGLTNGGTYTFANQFNAVTGGEIITSISVMFGDPRISTYPNGSPVTIKLWSDPNNDGNPADAVLLSSVTGVSAAVSTNTFVSYDIPDVTLAPGQSFFVGGTVTHAAGQYPIAFDQTPPTFAGRSYIDVGNSFTNFPVDSGSIFGNWMVRAQGIPLSSAVPEPGTIALLVGMGISGIALKRRRK